MACGGLKFTEASLSEAQKRHNATERVVMAAIEFMRHVRKIPFSAGKYFDVKIGVHHGSCIFGVLGYHKPQFSLIGGIVNTTSRISSMGSDNSINLSESAWEQIKNLGKFSAEVRRIKASKRSRKKERKRPEFLY